MREYRSDVDGLRAIAVLAVVLFHAGCGFPGGYVGVDVFLVLSGYLITGLLARDLDAGTFSLAGFRERRVRRILPAATVMVVVMLAAGLVLLMPEPAEKLGRSAVAQAAMLANVCFRLTADYFETQSECLPLLHLWSLAVEEQFSMLFPPVLAFAWRRGRRFVLPMLAGLALVSFAWSIHQLGRDPEGTFYLLPSRAWELLVGAMLALRSPPTGVPRSIRTASSGAGLVALLGACVAYRTSTPFPGLAAALPCLGTGLVLWSESAGLTAFGRMLSFGPMRFIGIVSYSLYLWHWPVLALTRCTIGEKLEPAVTGTAVLAAFGLAVLSWRLVEAPFRRASGRLPCSTVLIRGALASVATAAFGAAIWSIDGWPGRMPTETTRLLAGNRGPRHLLPPKDFDFRMRPPSFGACGHSSADEPTLVLWGDSHALAASEVLDRATAEAGLCGVALLRTGAPPVPGLWRSGESPESALWNDRVLEWIERTPSVRHVVLAGRWSIGLVPDTDDDTSRLVVDAETVEVTPRSAEEALGRRLAAVIDRLGRHGITVWLLKEVPLQRFSPEQVAFRSTFGRSRDFRGVDRATHERRVAAVERALAAVDPSRMRVLDPSESLFDGNGVSVLGDPEGSYYYDRHHLSPRGARRAIAPVAARIIAAIGDPSAAGDASP